MSLYDNKIDIIIPVYNTSNELLTRCLSSIAIQNIVDDVEITIIDDASVQNYESIISFYNNIMKINYIRLNQNVGPGLARQEGINNTNHEFIVFIDSDDTLYDYKSLYYLREAAHIEPTSPLINSRFVGFRDKENEKNADEFTYFNLSHLFGKIYRRSFIEKYNIHFNPTIKTNEDTGFNAMIQLFSGNSENIKGIDKMTYVWRDNNQSITRKNNYIYSSTLGDISDIATYVYCVNYSINYAYNISNTEYLYEIIDICLTVLSMLYWRFLMDEEYHQNNNLKYTNLFFNESCLKIMDYISTSDVIKYFNQLSKQYYSAGYLDNILITISFTDYMDKVQNYKEEDI